MEREIEINLPISGQTVTIRNYTTREDDEKAENILYLGVNSTQKSTGEKELVFPVANIMASQASYIPRLVKSIDGDSTNLALRLKQLDTPDYQAIADKVDEIVERYSPKVKGAKRGSKENTSAS